MCMLDMKYEKIRCRTFYMEKTGVYELTQYSLIPIGMSAEGAL